jgi:tetratricopeptide (TPR) repeat protein
MDFKKLGKVLGIPLAGGFALGILLWPFGLLDPFGHTYESLTTFSNFPISVRVLFSGDMVMSNQIPFEYLFTWIIYTIPLAFIVGLVLFIISLKTSVKRAPLFMLLCNVFAFLFPLFYVLYKDSPLYDGWRHFNFVYAAGIPIVAMGFENVVLWVKKKNWKAWIIPAALGLLMLEPAIHIVRNYEYPYVYFNPIIGGMEGAFGNFELDYWGISSRQAVEELEDRGILKYPMDSSITLVSNFSYGTRIWLDDRYRDSVKMRFSRYRERYDDDWDYAIYVSRFMDGSHMKAIDWPGSNRVIETIDVNNTPITAIYQRKRNYAFEARKAMRSGNVQKALELFNKEIAFDPKNELAYNFIGQIYMDQRNFNKAIEFFLKAKEYAPDKQQVNINLALAYANTNQVPKANNLLLQMVEKDGQNFLAYYYLALIAFNSNNASIAARYIEDSIEARPNFRQAYVLGSQIYRSLGDNARASYFESIANQLK